MSEDRKWKMEKGKRESKVRRRKRKNRRVKGDRRREMSEGNLNRRRKFRIDKLPKGI
jgi:hypothetical protein